MSDVLQAGSDHTMLHSELDLHRPCASTAASRTPRVLVAANTHGTPPEVLDFARELVALLGAELHLLRVTASERTERSSDSNPVPAHPSVVSLVQRDGHSVAIAEGDFVPTVSGYALEVNASLVIVSDDAQRGRHVSKIVRSSGRAVLVARRKLANGIILAATDLSDPRFPVVRQAGALGAIARVSVAAMHNVCPARVELDMDAGRVTRIEANRTTTSRQLQALVQVTSSFSIQTAVLTSLLDPVDAIVREARSRVASLIVVGAHLDGSAAKRTSVSADVVKLAPTSVLVVPLSGTDSAPEQPRVDSEPTTAE